MVEVRDQSRVPIGIADLPLSGIRILSVEQYGAGPFATLYLADMGAEIIKIEAPLGANGTGGDSSRQSGPHFLGPNDSHFYQTFNLGKKSVTLDIRTPEGKAVFHRLVSTADAVVNNLRGDQPAKLGLDFASLRTVNPRVVCAHLSGYGRTGERSTWPAYDYLMQAEAGYLSLTGEPDGPPTRMGLSIIDYLTGITTAFAVSANLLGAMKTGRGRDVDVTLFDVAMHQLTYPAVWYLNESDVTHRRPRSGHPSVVPCEFFPTKDGQVFIMCVLPKFWELFAAIAGRPDLPTDPLFATPEARRKNRAALMAILDPVMAARTTGEWVELLSGKVPVAPVRTLPEALENPYLDTISAIQAIDHPARPGFKVLSNPIRVDGSRAAARPAPALGADTDAVLREAGYSDAEISALRATAII